MLDPKEAREQLKIDFENTAEWRRQKAEEYAKDSRNLEAARALDHLAETVDGIDEASIDAYAALFDDLPDAEHHSELLRSIGFSWHPATAIEFIQRYISDRTGG